MDVLQTVMLGLGVAFSTVGPFLAYLYGHHRGERSVQVVADVRRMLNIPESDVPVAPARAERDPVRRMLGIPESDTGLVAPPEPTHAVLTGGDSGRGLPTHTGDAEQDVRNFANGRFWVLPNGSLTRSRSEYARAVRVRDSAGVVAAPAEERYQHPGLRRGFVTVQPGELMQADGSMLSMGGTFVENHERAMQAAAAGDVPSFVDRVHGLVDQIDSSAAAAALSPITPVENRQPRGVRIKEPT